MTLRILSLLALLASASTSFAWWDKAWTGRKSFTVDTTSEGGAISEPIGTTAVLVRLHGGNFNFGAVKEDGSDLRFVSGDDKTVLPHRIEKWDGLMNEAFVWVQVPAVKPGEKTPLWLYFGNAESEAPDAKQSVYGEDTVLVYHFGDATPQDASPAGNNAESPATVSEGAQIGGGLRLLGNNPVKLPASSSLEWQDGQLLTMSFWVKPSSLQPNATLFVRQGGGNSFRIGLDNGVPFVEVRNAGGVQKSPPGEPLAVGVWKQIAVLAEGSKITLFVDGVSYSSLSAAVPPLTTESYVGGEGPEATSGAASFVGEMDELVITKVGRPLGAVAFEAINQSGSERSQRLLVAGEDEASEGGGGHNHVAEHLSLFGEISKSLTFDGWAVIGLCSIMAVIGWVVAVQKFFYLNKVKKGSDEFLKQWHNVSTDLTLLDHADENSVKTLGGTASAKAQRLMHKSPLFQLYHIGSTEISHRLKADRKGLSARSIQAIRASLDGGLVRELQRLNGQLIFLTISIAGGPYLGLLGTVIGVMITFATIAKTGEVEVNSIAPGIAGALLATVAGLIVAIPALFIYSYLASRIKEISSTMHVFIDEFVTKMAEFYPE